MKKKDFLSQEKDVVLVNPSEKLTDTRKKTSRVPYELHYLTDYMSKVIESDEIIPEELIIILDRALDDLEKNECDFSKKAQISSELNALKDLISVYLRFFPIIIDAIADKEFSEKFRILFKEHFFEPEPPIMEYDDFGVIIIKENVVDISNKDKAEVLASLYNNSHPQGLGILHYNPAPMPIEVARQLLQTHTSFDYLAGRVMKINLESNIVYTYAYNMDNGPKAAEKAIASCRNVYNKS